MSIPEDSLKSLYVKLIQAYADTAKNSSIIVEQMLVQFTLAGHHTDC